MHAGYTDQKFKGSVLDWIFVSGAITLAPDNPGADYGAGVI